MLERAIAESKALAEISQVADQADDYQAKETAKFEKELKEKKQEKKDKIADVIKQQAEVAKADHNAKIE